jgi:hypothetical protein
MSPWPSATKVAASENGPAEFTPWLVNVYAPVSEASVNTGVDGLLELAFPPQPTLITKIEIRVRLNSKRMRTGYLQFWILQELCSI